MIVKENDLLRRGTYRVVPKFFSFTSYSGKPKIGTGGTRIRPD